jgi:hypothetical protein
VKYLDLLVCVPWFFATEGYIAGKTGSFFGKIKKDIEVLVISAQG